MKNCLICNNKLLPRQKKFCSNKCYGTFLKDNPSARNHFKDGAKAWNKGLKGYHSGKRHWKWKGGRRLNKSNGYIEIYTPGHPYTNYKKIVYEHRLIMEKHIDRFLYPKERVHHINGIKTDNRIENLQLFPSNSKHVEYHHWLKKNNNL